jgi:hypothetical protein
LCVLLGEAWPICFCLVIVTCCIIRGRLALAAMFFTIVHQHY